MKILSGQTEGMIVQDTDEVATGKRHRYTYRGEYHYFNAFPGEVYISSVRHKDLLTAAGLEGMARMTALALRYAPLEEVLSQLEKSSISMKNTVYKMDLPAILHEVITEDSKSWPKKK